MCVTIEIVSPDMKTEMGVKLVRSGNKSFEAKIQCLYIIEMNKVSDLKDNLINDESDFLMRQTLKTLTYSNILIMKMEMS